MARAVVLDRHGREFEPDRIGFKRNSEDRQTQPLQKPADKRPDVPGGGVWTPERCWDL